MDRNKHVITTIDAYIATFSDEMQRKLQELREVIRAAAPEATEKISYQMPTFYLNGNLVHFAAYKQHIGFYPTPSGTEHFQKELSPYKTSKGTVQFPLDQPIPFDLVTKMVNFRVAENKQKALRKERKIRAS
jgi:uncharacterized protein YdhG (YjbR/CyaY superfamily)